MKSSFSDGTIHIVAATDNHYAILLAALIKSVELNHHSFEKLCFYIIDDGISKVNKAKLESTINPAVTSLRWFDSKKILLPDIDLPLHNSSFPDTTLMRLFIPYIVPPEVRKVLFLDVDMLVLKDIADLYNTDLDGRVMAAVQDLDNTMASGWEPIPNYRELGIPPEAKYFNAGLLLIDPQKWREQELPKKIIRFLTDNVKHAKLIDQYGLNGVLYNQWLELDPLWNTFAYLKIDNPFIIHFVQIKPIFRSYNGNPVYREEFYRYLKKTAWHNFEPIGDHFRILKKIDTKLSKMARFTLRFLMGAPARNESKGINVE